MASITRRPDGAWRARVTVDGREMAKHFPRKVDAERWAAIQEGKQATGEWVDPRKGEVTLREYAEAWREGSVHRGSTSALVESHLRLHVYPVLGRRPLGQLRQSELQSWVKSLQAGGLAPATVETIAHIVGSIFRSAIRDRILVHHPMDGVKVPKPERAIIRPITPEELGVMLDATPERWRAPMALGAGCGLRSGEVLGLGPSSVDFLRRRIRVERQLITPAKPTEPFRLGPPKTRTSKREVVLPSPVAEALAYHLERWPMVELPELGPLIFTSARGLPIRRQRLGEVAATAAEAAGITATFHDLRHHYASLLIASGLSVKAVQSALGHATAAETLDTYGHLWPAEEETMAAAVERAWKASPWMQKAPTPEGEGSQALG